MSADLHQLEGEVKDWSKRIKHAQERNDAEVLLDLCKDLQDTAHPVTKLLWTDANTQVREQFEKDASQATWRLCRTALFRIARAAHTMMLLSYAQRARRIVLEKRVEALEAKLSAWDRKSFQYCGVWSAKDAYGEHDFVTHDGSMWCCLTPTSSKPGTDESWQLCVKKGRDGRDAR